jgi:hypothetical protein
MKSRSRGWLRLALFRIPGVLLVADGGALAILGGQRGDYERLVEGVVLLGVGTWLGWFGRV